jgi:2'-hydroxyisoflavone reductase
MRLLIVGGTRFVGRYLAAEAIAQGHDVSLLHLRPSELFPEAEHLLTDRDGDLSLLSGKTWDATIDVTAYYPRQLRSLAAALDGNGGQYVFVSSISAYAVPPAAGYTEDTPLKEPIHPEPDEITAQTYGPLKVMCEQAATSLFGSSTLIIRPTYVIGPLDYTARFTYWVHRIARGGDILAPGFPERMIQTIDGRDLASFTVSATEQGLAGAFHTVNPAPPFSFGDMLETIGSVTAKPGTTLHWADPDFLTAQGLTGADLPLWPMTEGSSLMGSADPSAAFAAGLQPRPLTESIKDILEQEPVPEMFLTPQRESEVLAAWQQHREQA